MSKVFIGYTTNAGSTSEIVNSMASELRQEGHSVDTGLLSNKVDLEQYDGVLIGAPMILGWHKDAVTFVKQHRESLANKKVAYFACALKLTLTPFVEKQSDLLSLDPTLAADPADPKRLQFKERFTTVDHYVEPMIAIEPTVKPLNIAIFNGMLDMSRLKLWQKLFVRFVVQAEPGDFRNWDYIKTWSKSMGKQITAGN